MFFLSHSILSPRGERFFFSSEFTLVSVSMQGPTSADKVILCR